MFLPETPNSFLRATPLPRTPPSTGLMEVASLPTNPQLPWSKTEEPSPTGSNANPEKVVCTEQMNR